MKIAHKVSKAVASVQGRKSILVRRVLAAALIGSAAVSAAYANPGQQRGQQQQRPSYGQEYQRPAQRPQYDQRDQRDQQRQFDERAFEARAEAQRREIDQQQQYESRRNGRMSADERRDLRRQINEAGADIYPNERRRR